MTAAIAALLPSLKAEAQTASRVYKLCLIEDPSCMPLLRQAYEHAVEINKAPPPGIPRFCPHGHILVDGQILGPFMQMAEATPEFLGYQVDIFEAYVLQFALPCRPGE